MKTNKLYKLIVPLLFLAGSIGVAWGQGMEPVKEDKYLKLDLPYSNITSIYPGDNIEEKNDESNNGFGLYDHSDDTWYKYKNGESPEITFTFQKEETVSSITIMGGGNYNSHAQKVTIKVNDTQEKEYTVEIKNTPNATYSFELEPIKTTKLTIKLEPQKNQWVTVQDIWIYVLPTIQHKYAKWHDQRGNAEYDDDFDDTKWFDTSANWRPGIASTQIQATHTYIDTIYAHRGSTVQLTLPDYLNEDISIQSYQRWYSFRTGQTFATRYANENENDEERIVDLLTPTVDNFYYRLANGYVGSPLSDWNTSIDGDICSMNFYIPKDENEFKEMFPGADNITIDNDWYVVACDVSGYTDYTETFNEKNTTSKFTDSYYEPTLSHRVVFYIHAVEDKDSWYYKNWEEEEAYLEEYEINMPFTRYVDKTYEVVALSKDARSYVNPNPNQSGTDDGKLTVTIDTNDNDAGIELKELTGNTNEGHMKQEGDQWVISGENRVISFDYPTNNSNGTKQVKDKNGDGHSSATIIVKKGDKNIARFKLNFIKGTSLMTQSMIKALNEKRKGDTGTEVDEAWNYPERTPQYMEENYEFLTGLDFNFKGANHWQETYYPYPLAWGHCSYAFFDGSTGDYFKGSTFPEWGYYSIMNKYLECANPSSDQDTWGWVGHEQAKEPNDECMEPRIEGETNLYHMFIDASDRPGIIARLPFKVLCPGTELFVSAWVKSAKWNQSVDNAAMLFTIMGVTGDGKYVPLYRHQTGQIPATYMNGSGNLPQLPGFDKDSNQWFQIAFSFITDENITTEYNSYVLQIENNSASTRGGDMYLDDVRVYMKKVEAEVKQLESTCGNERTRLNFSIDWEQLLSRTGEPDLTANADGNYDGANGFPTTDDDVPFSGIGLCFIDKEKFDKLSSSGENFDDCIVWIGANDGDGTVNNYRYAAMFYKLDYDKNTSYTKGQTYEDGALAKNNDWFFYYDEENENRKLTVDFFADIKPYKKYIMMVVPLSAEDLEASLEQGNSDMDKVIEYIRGQLKNGEYTTQFQDIHGDCAIKTEITVTSQSLIMVNGKVLDPTTDEYCIGQVLNFSVQLQIPNGENEEGEQQYEDFDEEVYFDWYFGTDEDFGIGEDGEVKSESLAEALETLRDIDEYKNVDETTIESIEPKDKFTQEMKALIINALGIGVEGGSNAKLVMHRTSLNITLLEGGLDLVVRPIQVSLEDDNAEVCWEPLYFHLDPKGKAPELHPGFHDVNYPGGIEPNLRVGLKQIKEATSNNPIKVNLRGAKPVTNDSKKLVEQNSNKFIYLIGTNDSKVELDYNDDKFDELYPVGKIVTLQAQKEGSANDYMTIYFDEALTKAENNDFVFNPREGYEYLLRIPFQEEGQNEDTESEGQQSICYGSFNLLMKVVPAYQKWIGEATDNWNNDENWVRSKKDELKKGDDYSDYKEDHQGYVPMKFTKVTIPGATETEAAKQVELYAALENGEASGNTHKILNLLPTANTTGVIGEATSNIEYDLMVKNVADDDGSYSCETYYTNTVDEIHFEPSAEMLHAELLDYNKAWVDYKLESDKWHTLASPLQGVVAGDFYTDSEGSGTNVAGTENQEYFTDITFDGDQSDANNANIPNSRFKPSVYQRGWGKDAKMITVGDDGPNTVAVQGNWSAVYNDVYDEYKPGEGFSLKVLDMPDDKKGGDAIFRLPKADPNYDYYSAKTRNNEGEIDRITSHRLAISEREANSDEVLKVTLDETANGSYYLVGNPFMANLDAKKFLTDGANSSLADMYWFNDADGVQNIVAIEDGDWITTDSETAPIIPPLHSFFVRKADNASGNVTVTFKDDMQVLGTATSDETTNTNALILTAQTADGKTSRAAIAYDATAKTTYETSEDAELFLDSNLSDVPTIYTVAGTMATSINRTSELYNIPVGIYGNSTETVTLSVEGLKNFSSAALYDAEKRTETPLREGTTITLPANTSGRYFLRAGTPTANEVYTMNGAQVKHTKAGVCSFELYLPDGIYLITAQNTSGETQTEKVVVR